MALSINKGLACLEKQCREAFERFHTEKKGTCGYRSAQLRYFALRDKIRIQKKDPDWHPDKARQMRLARDVRKGMEVH